jgi:hypothetical protein
MRIKLCDKYNNEREEICKKLIDILKLDMNNSFLLSDLDDDVEMQTEILNMKDEIQKCFACSNISSFKPNFDCKRLLIIINIFLLYFIFVIKLIGSIALTLIPSYS